MKWVEKGVKTSDDYPTDILIHSLPSHTLASLLRENITRQ